MSNIAVVDLGTGNLHSVSTALERVAVGQSVSVTRDPLVIKSAERIVLPGQGAIRSWLEALSAEGLETVLTEAIASKPVLGICLGLQSLYQSSEEDGGAEGLGVLSG